MRQRGRMQCDQIRRFLEFLGIKFYYKSLVTFWALVKTIAI